MGGCGNPKAQDTYSFYKFLVAKHRRNSVLHVSNLDREWTSSTHSSTSDKYMLGAAPTVVCRRVVVTFVLRSLVCAVSHFMQCCRIVLGGSVVRCHGVQCSDLSYSRCVPLSCVCVCSALYGDVLRCVVWRIMVWLGLVFQCLELVCFAVCVCWGPEPADGPLCLRIGPL